MRYLLQSVPGSLGPGVEGSLGQKVDGRRCWKVGVQRKWAHYCCPGLDKPTAGQPLGTLCSVPLQAILRRQHKRRCCPHRPEVLATGFPPCGPLPPLGSALFSLQREAAWIFRYLGMAGCGAQGCQNQGRSRPKCQSLLWASRRLPSWGCRLDGGEPPAAKLL